MAEPTIGLTGGTGVLGRRLAHHFTRNGRTVIAYSADIRDGDQLERFVDRSALIVHAAAIVPVKTVESNLAEAIGVNVAGTAALAAMAASKNKPVALISTSHVYAPQAGALSEGSPLAPASAYGLTKLQAEQWVRRLCDDPLIVRLFSYFDENQASEYLIPSLRRRIAETADGGTISLAGAHNIRDIASADWLAERCVRLILGGARGTVNLCTGQPWTVIDIAKTLGHHMGRGDLAWQESQTGAPNSLLGDPGLSNRLIGAEPSFDLGSAFARMVG